MERVLNIGPDRVTVRSNEIVIEARHEMPDWQLRELHPVPIYFEDKRYLLAQKRKAVPPFRVRYTLCPWPETQTGSTRFFWTYDAEAVAERETNLHIDNANELIFFCLLPLYPVLGLFWSGTQQWLTRFGFVPRHLTVASLLTAACALILLPFLFLAGLASRGVTGQLVLASLWLACVVDLPLRYFRCFRDDQWFGGFMEWLVPPVPEMPEHRPIESPGFLMSLELAFWSLFSDKPHRRRRVVSSRLNLPPVVERELQVALRKLRPVRRRWRMAVIALVLLFVCLLLEGFSQNRTSGRSLHWVLFVAGLTIVLRAPRWTAGAFSAERREQTLGMLFLSGLSATEVFLSKVLSSAIIVFTELLAITPVLALPFFLGGISFDLFLATAFCLPNLLLFVLAVSLLASVMTEQEGQAWLLTWILVAVICAIAPAIHGCLAGSAKPSVWWLRLSPAYGPWLVLSRFASAPPVEFWRNFGITFAWSVLCLGIAAFILSRIWRERADPKETAPWLQGWRQFLQGAPAWRQKVGRQWLDVNAFAWFAARNRQPVATAWILIGGLTVAWLVGWAAMGNAWLRAPNVVLVALLLTLALRWAIQQTAASNLSNLRREGGYELLLTTPLQPSDIVWGQLEALRQQFRALTQTVLALQLGLLVAGFVVQPFNLVGWFIYFGTWTALLWWQRERDWKLRGALLPMWVGLNCGQPGYATWRTFRSELWILFLIAASSAFCPPVGAGAMIVFLLRTGAYAQALESRLVREFREIVREPIPDPHDRRFRRWKVHERFPWGWEMAQQQLHERLARRG